jgi:hypothetical protein
MRNIVVLSSLLVAASVQASTVAYWRFEDGPVNTPVLKPAVPGGPGFAPSVFDSSGSGNALSVWDEGGAGYTYRSSVSSSTVPQTGATNNFSVQNSGGGPAMFTQTGGFLQTWTPSAFTIEASIKPENGGFRTIVGRDSQGGYLPNTALAAMYFQITPTNALAFKYLDVSGNFHDATSADGVIQSWNPSGGSPNDVPWQSIAAVSDGTNLTVYLDNGSGYNSVVSIALGGGNTAFSPGTGDGGDWDPGIFSVGRGLYNGGHTDRGYGLIDEVRFSDTALTPSQLLNSVPETSTALLGLLGVFGLVRRRR